MKAEKARRDAERRRRAEAARRRADEEQRKAEEEQRKADEKQRKAEEEQRKADEARGTQVTPDGPTAPPDDAAPAVELPATGAPAADPDDPETMAPADPLRPDESTEGARISPLVYVGFGVAAVGTVVGAITGGISFDQAATLKDDCVNDECEPELESDIDSMLALGHASTASFIIAGAGAVTGIVGILLSDFSGAESTARSWQLLVGPAHVGLRIDL